MDSAGVNIMTWFAVGAELLQDWRSEEGAEYANILGLGTPWYGDLIEAYGSWTQGSTGGQTSNVTEGQASNMTEGQTSNVTEGETSNVTENTSQNLNTTEGDQSSATDVGNNGRRFLRGLGMYSLNFNN